MALTGWGIAEVIHEEFSKDPPALRAALRLNAQGVSEEDLLKAATKIGSDVWRNAVHNALRDLQVRVKKK